LSGDRKVAPTIRVKKNNEGDIKVKNSFGLPAGWSCPGATTFCEGCYALSSEKRYPGVRRLVDHNLAELQAAGTVEAMATLLDDMIQEFRKQADKHEARKVFRIHWDGDFYSEDYAQAWAVVIARNPDVRFWAYTRSFTDEVNVVPILAGLRNLTLYLSVDEYNQDVAVRVALRYPQVLVAACDETQEDAAGILQAMDRGRAPKCPENVRKIPLMLPLDRRGTVSVGDQAQGACVACGLCIDGKADVRFATKKR
jgi:hypothetical protein